LRAPLGPEQELRDRNGGEEAQGIVDQRGDDPDGGQDGHGGTGEQQADDPALDPVPGAHAGADLAEDEQGAQQGGEGGADDAAEIEHRADSRGAPALVGQHLGIGCGPDLNRLLAGADGARVSEEGLATEGFELLHGLGRAGRRELAFDVRRDERGRQQDDQGGDRGPDQGVGAVLGRA